MQTHKIEIDREVYIYLQGHARPFEDSANDVLRRLLLESGDRPTPQTEPPRLGAQRRLGDLMPLIDLGLLRAGDELLHEQPRKGVVHRGSVTSDGWLRVDGQDFAKVSPALKACVGHEINGWRNWTHHRSGRPLEELREDLRRTQSGSQ